MLNIFMRQKKYIAALAVALVSLPVPALAQSSTITGILMLISGWILSAVYVVMGLTLVFFLWGVVQYITAGDNEEGRTTARNTMIYGILGLFVMTSVWGLVYFLGTVVGIEPGAGGGDVPVLPGEELTGQVTGGWFFENVRNLNVWFSMLVVILIGLAMLYFLWGIARYVAHGADEEKRTEARRMIVYGITGLFAMVSVWGLVEVIASTFNVGLGGGIGKDRMPYIDSIDIGGGNKITGEAPTACVPWDPNSADGSTFKAFVCYILGYLNTLPPVLVSLCLVYLFWGIAKYMGASGEEELRSGRNSIIYGSIALFVLVGLWALVFIVQREFGLGYS
jgi:hypothetical protein